MPKKPNSIKIRNRPPVAIPVGWFRAIDDEAHFSYFPNSLVPTDLDAWEARLDVTKLNYETFPLTLKSEDYIVKLNGEEATLSDFEELPTLNPRWQAIVGTKILVFGINHFTRLELDENETLPDEEKHVPLLAISAARGIGEDSLGFSFSFTVDVTNKNTEAVIMRLTANINSNFTKVSLTNSNSPKLKTKSMDGEFFYIESI